MDLSLAEIVMAEAEGPAALRFGSPGFCRLTLQKLVLIRDRLCTSETPILWVDNDVYFFENPLDELLGHGEDFVMQDDTNMPCTGFWLVRANDRARGDISAMIEMFRERGEGFNDQLAFGSLRDSGRMKSSLRLLPRERYPNGLTYFERGLKVQARLVHNNWLAETAAKVRRFEENGLWRPDPSILEGLQVVES